MLSRRSSQHTLCDSAQDHERGQQPYLEVSTPEEGLRDRQRFRDAASGSVLVSGVLSRLKKRRRTNRIGM